MKHPSKQSFKPVMAVAVASLTAFSILQPSVVQAGDFYLAPYVSAGTLNQDAIDESYLLPELGLAVGAFLHDQISVEFLYTLEASAEQSGKNVYAGSGLVSTKDEVSRQMMMLSGQFYLDLGRADGFVSAGVAQMDMEAIRTFMSSTTGSTIVTYYENTSNALVLEAGALINDRHRPSLVINSTYDSDQDYSYVGLAYRYLFRW